jgi:hypothetical protein
MVSRTCISVGNLRVLGNSLSRLELPQGRGLPLIDNYPFVADHFPLFGEFLLSFIGSSVKYIGSQGFYESKRAFRISSQTTFFSFGKFGSSTGI